MWERIDYDGRHDLEKNETGERILDFVSVYELAILNTFFRKKEEECIIVEGTSHKLFISFIFFD